MLAECEQSASQIDDALSVQLKTLNGGSAGGRRAKQCQSVTAPPKVRSPFLPARVIKRHSRTGHQVVRDSRREFVAVAALA